MIETNQSNLDLGQVKMGTDTLFEVKILNSFPGAKIVIPQFSCGACTHLVSSPDIIPPGREGIFKFRYHPTGTGAQVKSIFFNIDGKTEQTFLFQANVIE